MRYLSILLILLGCQIIAHASINPIYKECMQRGYSVDGEECVFPDSSRCSLESFNSGNCGQQWLTDDYCIPKGNYVWDAERCCDGLVAYLPEGNAGQATCQPKNEVVMNEITGGMGNWMIGLIALLLVGLLVLRWQSSRGRGTRSR